MAMLLLLPLSCIAYPPPLYSSHLPDSPIRFCGTSCSRSLTYRFQAASLDLLGLSCSQTCSCREYSSLYSSRGFSRISSCEAGNAAFGQGLRREWFLDAAMAATGGNGTVSGGAPRRSSTRSVVEHAVLFRMKEDFSEEQEKEMLDYLYTLQYHCKGILSISLGRVVSANAEGVTHGFFTRFPNKETLIEYMNHPARLKVRDELIRPFYYGLIEADYVADVEDDIEPLFRRGEDFEQGVELITLIKVKENTSTDAINHVLSAWTDLANVVGEVVQITAGTNFSQRNSGYTHGFVARLTSEDALEAFTEHPSYRNVMSAKVEPISTAMLSVHYLVQPVQSTVV